MKRLIAILSLFLLTISLCACKSTEQKTEDIYTKIHNQYYTIGSYSADCSVTAYTTGGENTYSCTVDYNAENGNYKIVSDDMTINLEKDKTVISKGSNTIESAPSEADMYIFVNTFFKSYYESEDTTVSVNAGEESDSTLLECSVINPTDYASTMKLWIDNENVLPTRMQVYDKNDKINTEINFRSFEFNR